MRATLLLPSPLFSMPAFAARPVLIDVSWLRGKDNDLQPLTDKFCYNVALDGADEYVYLAPNRVNRQLTRERFPEVRFLETREIY